MRRLSIRLPDPAHEALEQRAHESGLPVASAASGLLRTLLVDEDAMPAKSLRAQRQNPQTQRPTTRPSTIAHPTTTAHPASSVCANPAPKPPWLPSETDPHWAENTWGAIIALHSRYPRALAKLEHDWHQHPDRVETLAALATWRAGIDIAAEDPREELAFHNALQQLTRNLDHSAGLARPFKPNTPMPPDWRSPGL